MMHNMYYFLFCLKVIFWKKIDWKYKIGLDHLANTLLFWTQKFKLDIFMN